MLIRILLSLGAALPGGAPAAEPLIVSRDWVAQHLKDKGLVIFQIGDPSSKPAYDAAHLPGARFLNPFRDLAAPRVEGALALELPPADSLVANLERLGVSNDSRIVLYWAQEYFSPTSRTVFTLEYAGLAGRVSVMDGGIEAWQKEGRPVTTDVPAVTPGHFVLKPHPEIVASAEFVKAHLEDPKVRIVDARDTVFYTGARESQGKKGHIPGATSIYFGSVVDSTRNFLSPAALKALFTSAGVKDGQTVVTYCHIGQQATFVWFAARVLGYDARLYDGSFQDWVRHADYPVTNPAEKPE